MHNVRGIKPDMYIHIFKRHEKWLAFNPHTMCVLDLTEEEASLLSTFTQAMPAKYFTGKSLALPQDVATLSEKIEKEGFFGDAARSAGDGVPATIEVVLNVAQLCNLACTYCFSDNRVGKIMPSAVARKAITDAFDRHSGFDCFRLSFFGGEPTLSKDVIYDAVRFHKRECGKRGVRADYFIITNGVKLDEDLADFFADFGFEVQVSVDGDRSIHDKYRRDHKGRGTYEKVLQTIDMLRTKPNLRLSTSSVITKNNNAKEVHDRLDGWGLENMKLDMVYEFQDLGSEDFRSQDADFSAKYGSELGAVADRYAQKVINWEKPSEYNFRQSVLLLWQKKKKSMYCPAAQSRFGVGVDGKYYPCGASASLKENALGSVDGGISTDAVAAFTDKLNVAEKEPCRSCWARPLCLGGCPLTVRSFPSRLHCASRKNMAELSIGIFSEIREKNPLSFLTIIDEERARLFATQLGEDIFVIMQNAPEVVASSENP